MSIFNMKKTEAIFLRWLIFSLFLTSISIAQPPTIIETWNSKTQDSTTTFSVELNDLIIFNAKADQEIDTWNWRVNGILQTLPIHQYGPTPLKDCTYRIWTRKDNTTYTIEVNGININGTTNSIYWTIYVPPKKGNLSGTVADTSNNPLSGVIITDGTYTISTNVNGDYIFNNLTEGDYAFTAYKDGYVWVTKQVEINVNQTAIQDFQLADFNPAIINYTGSYIEVTNGDASISIINDAINDTSILEEVSSKVWLLKKDIKGSNAGLYINGDDCEELRLLSMNDGNEVKVSAYSSYLPGPLPLLHIFNTSITSWNILTNGPAPDTDSSRARIEVVGSDAEAVFNNSNFGYLYFYLLPGKSIFMENCTAEHTNGYRPSSGYGLTWSSIRNSKILDAVGVLGTDAAISSGFDNFISENNIISCQDNKAVALSGDNAVIRNNLCLYIGIGSGLGVGRGGGAGGLNQLIINSVSMNIEHNGIDVGGYAGNPLINVTLKNNETFATYDNGYYVTTWDYETPEVQNPLLEDCIAHEINSRPLCVDPGVNVTVRRFKSWNSHSGINIINSVNQESKNTYIIDSEIEVLDAQTDYTLYITKTENVNVINTKRNNDRTWIENADVTFWYYLDVLVQDDNGNPVEDAIVTISHPNITIDWYGDSSDFRELEVKPINLHVIPREYTEGLLDPQYITQTFTGADGHTPLPLNNDYTLVIEEHRLDRHGSPWYEHPLQTTYLNNYTITAEKYGISALVTGIEADEAWYREDPNTYSGIPEKGTITIILPLSSVSEILVYPNPFKGDQGWSERITFGNLPTEATIRIYTLSGDLVKKIEHQAQTDGGIEEWNINDITSGVYIYSVKSTSGNKIGKVSIVK